MPGALFGEREVAPERVRSQVGGIDDCVGGSQSTISSLGTGEAPENDAYGIVPRELRKTSMVERKMEAMGSKAAKIRVAEPLSDRLASLLRPIVRCV